MNVYALFVQGLKDIMWSVVVKEGQKYWISWPLDFTNIFQLDLDMFIWHLTQGICGLYNKDTYISMNCEAKR